MTDKENKCKVCKGTGYVQIGEDIRGLKPCEYCNGKRKQDKEKSARKMFEEIGYEFVGESSVITYQKPINNCFGKGYSNITFNKETLNYYCIDFINIIKEEKLIDKKYYDCEITMDINKAIQKQIEELKW